MNELPKGWVHTNVGTISDISSGFGFPDRFQGKKAGDLAFAKVRDLSHAYKNTSGRLLFADNYVNRDELGALKARSVQAGSIAFAKIGEALRQNRRVILDIEAILDNNCMAVTPDQRLAHAEFVYRFLTTVDLSPFAVATTVPSVRRGDIEGIEFPLPPLTEQRRIVAKIDSVSGKSRRGRDHLDHIPRLVEKYKQAVLGAAFRGDLTREWRAETTPNAISITDLEEIRASAWRSMDQRGRYVGSEGINWHPDIDLPTGWVWASVDQLSFAIQYGSSAKTTGDDTGVAVLRMGNLQGGELDFSALKFLPRNHDEFPDLLLDDGDVLFNRTNSAELVGKTAVYGCELDQASFASYLIRVKTCGMKPHLLSNYINSLYGREWVASVVNQQVGQANVNGTKLRLLGVPVMPLAEQEEILRRVKSAFAWINRLASDATSARKLIDRLDQAVLAKAFRGELVPQNPADEPASVLLDRIRVERNATPKAKRGRAEAH